MDWLAATVLGACGGAVVQLIDLAVAAKEWRSARHRALLHPKVPLPKLSLYVDAPADSLVLLTRLALGAVAGFIFHAEVVGATAAVAVGASAPALLKQLGALHSLKQAGEEPRSETAAPQQASGITPATAEEG